MSMKSRVCYLFLVDLNGTDSSKKPLSIVASGSSCFVTHYGGIGNLQTSPTYININKGVRVVLVMLSAN